jgi:hypothetical protein
MKKKNSSLKSVPPKKNIGRSFLSKNEKIRKINNNKKHLKCIRERNQPPRRRVKEKRNREKIKKKKRKKKKRKKKRNQEKKKRDNRK